MHMHIRVHLGNYILIKFNFILIFASLYRSIIAIIGIIILANLSGVIAIAMLTTIDTNQATTSTSVPPFAALVPAIGAVGVDGGGLRVG